MVHLTIYRRAHATLVRPNVNGDWGGRGLQKRGFWCPGDPSKSFTATRWYPQATSQARAPRAFPHPLILILYSPSELSLWLPLPCRSAYRERMCWSCVLLNIWVPEAVLSHHKSITKIEKTGTSYLVTLFSDINQ